MATVPGVPDRTVPNTFAPTQADMLIAAHMHQQRQMQLAGDVLPFVRKQPPLYPNPNEGDIIPKSAQSPAQKRLDALEDAMRKAKPPER